MNLFARAKNDLKQPLLPMRESKTIEIDSEEESMDIQVGGSSYIDEYVCNITNATHVCGFLVGMLFQFLTMYVFGGQTVDDEGEADSIQLRPEVPFYIYAICRYWVFMAFILPPLVTIMVQKYRLRTNARSRAEQASMTMKNLESCFECFRFQLGIFSGSIFQMSLVTFCTMSKTLPLSLLLASYVICMVVAFLFLCLLQTCVDQTFANISSVEIIVRYEKDEEDRE